MYFMTVEFSEMIVLVQISEPTVKLHNINVILVN